MVAQGTPTLVRDRFKSFQKRELIEPRVRQTNKKSRMFKSVETGAAGERERESHYALQAEIAATRQTRIANKKMGKPML
jgi:nucleolar protein 53